MGRVAWKGKNCCVENESKNAVFFRRRRTAQRIRIPACGLHAHGVRTYRLAGPGCGRLHDSTAGFAFWNPLVVLEIFWNVLLTLARKTLKKTNLLSSWLSTYIAPAQKIPIISPPLACLFLFILPCERDQYLPRGTGFHAMAPPTPHI